MAAHLEGPLKRRWLLAAALAAAFLALLAGRALFDPGVAFLPGGGAPWIVAPKPIGLRARFTVASFVHFRRRVAVKDAQTVMLRYRARRESQVVLDGKTVLPPGEAEGGWKRPRGAALRLEPGEHELLIIVRAEPGPAALSAEIPELGLRTDSTWEAAGEDSGWPPARLAAKPAVADAFGARPRALGSFLQTLLLMALLMLLSRRFLLAWPLSRPWLWAAGAWAAWAALGLLRRHGAAGYDAYAHAELISLIWTKGLPGPGDSWQSFQAPLYHLLCAPLASLGLDEDHLALAARLPNLFCGFGLAWLASRFAREAAPDAHGAAFAGGLFALALSPNLVMSQSPGNEPLAAFLSALFLLLCLRESGRAPGLATPPEAFLLGGTLGAALLAKTTAVLVLPAGLLLLGRRDRRYYGAALAGLLLAGGWWYLRGLLISGRLFTGGWHPGRGIAWTQDPGYHTAGDFLRFGAALGRPVYSGVAGFWDALWSTLWLDGWQGGLVSADVAPPWPPVWQAAASLWGLVPAAFLLRGAWKGMAEGRPASVAALLGLGTGLAALLWLFLTVPVYSTVKASYLLGLTPLAGLLVAEGVPRDGLAGRLAWPLLCGWALCSFLAHIPIN